MALTAPQPHPDVPTLGLPSDLSPFPLRCVRCAQRLCSHVASLLPPGNPLHRVPSPVRSGALPGALHPCPSHLLRYPRLLCSSPRRHADPRVAAVPLAPRSSPQSPSNPSPSPLNPRHTVCASCFLYPPTRLTLTARAADAPRPLQGTLLGHVVLRAPASPLPPLGLLALPGSAWDTPGSCRPPGPGLPAASTGPPRLSWLCVGHSRVVSSSGPRPPRCLRCAS